MGLFKKFMKKKAGKDPHLTICSPLTGIAATLSEVNDPVFAEEMMGKGIAIIPTIGQVVAPFDGEIITVFRTLHAVTMKGENGAEIIIHVGLDTVSLNGQYFESHVADGTYVRKGDLLLTFDLDKIKEEGYDVITPIVITNSSDFQSVETIKKKEVNSGDLLLSLT